MNHRLGRTNIEFLVNKFYFVSYHLYRALDQLTHRGGEWPRTKNGHPGSGVTLIDTRKRQQYIHSKSFLLRSHYAHHEFSLTTIHDIVPVKFILSTKMQIGTIPCMFSQKTTSYCFVLPRPTWNMFLLLPGYSKFSDHCTTNWNSYVYMHPWKLWYLSIQNILVSKVSFRISMGQYGNLYLLHLNSHLSPCSPECGGHKLEIYKIRNMWFGPY